VISRQGISYRIEQLFYDDQIVMSVQKLVHLKSNKILFKEFKLTESELSSKNLWTYASPIAITIGGSLAWLNVRCWFPNRINKPWSFPQKTIHKGDDIFVRGHVDIINSYIRMTKLDRFQCSGLQNCDMITVVCKPKLK
jgi:hypothetical protein